MVRPLASDPQSWRNAVDLRHSPYEKDAFVSERPTNFIRTPAKVVLSFSSPYFGGSRLPPRLQSRTIRVFPKKSPLKINDL
jgi:hypothetical protein